MQPLIRKTFKPSSWRPCTGNPVSMSRSSRRFVSSFDVSSSPRVYHVNHLKSPSMMPRHYSKRSLDQNTHIFSDKQLELVDKVVLLLTRLSEVLKTIQADEKHVEEVLKSIEQLKSLFLVVVVGEFNSGKSTFLNALLGGNWLEEGVTPTTSQVHIIKYNQDFSKTMRSALRGESLMEVGLPVEWLKQINMVDTPGTNAVVKGHQQITEDFVPRSDLVLFVTSSDRAFTESEKSFLEKIREFKKKIVFILTKIDNLQKESDEKDIMDFVSQQANQLLAEVPTIFPISARKALKSKIASLNKDLPMHEIQQLYKESRFETLESYILDQLSEKERGYLKIKNPLGIGEHYLKRYMDEGVQLEKILDDDIRTIEKIEFELDEFKKDMKREFASFQIRIDNLLLDLLNRGSSFFDEELVLTNIMSLTNSDQLRLKFENDVVSSFPTDVEKEISDVIDWIIEKNSKEWIRIAEYVQTAQKISRLEHKMVGSIKTYYDYNRSHLVASIGKNANTIISVFDKQHESLKLSAEVKASIYQTAVFEIGVVGLGALLSFSVLDATGIIGLSALAASGTVILPYKKSRLKSAYTEQVNRIRSELKNSLQKHFDNELELLTQSIRDNISPYTRFVKYQVEQTQKTKEELKQLSKDLSALSTETEQEFKVNQ